MENSSSSNAAPSSQALALSPIEASPPTPHQNRFQSPQPRLNHKRAGSEPYYEDVDPRFAVEEPSDDGYNRDSALPTALTPGGTINPGMPGGYIATPHALSGAQAPPQQSYGFPNRTQPPPQNPEYLQTRYVGHAGRTNDFGSNHGEPHLAASENSNDTLPEGAVSPGGGSERASETSHFTSISERPVNPNWQPGPGSRAGSAGGGSFVAGAPPPPRGPRREDVILGANPDFSIPGMGMGRPGRNRGGSRGGMAASNVSGAMMPGGRYPTDI